MPLLERAGEGEGGGGGEEWSRSPSSGTDRAAVFPAGLVIEYLVVPRRNFSLPLSSHPTPRPLPFPPIPIPPPPPHLLGEFHRSPRELHVQPARWSWGGGGRGHRGEEGAKSREECSSYLHPFLLICHFSPLTISSKWHTHTQTVFSVLKTLSPWSLSNP